MNAPTDQLGWLEGLPPSNFALVMATGIMSFAFDLTGQALLAQALFGITLFAWVRVGRAQRLAPS